MLSNLRHSYPACVQTLQYIVDTHPHLSLSLLNIPVSYPIPHAELIAKTRAAIEEAENDGTGRKVRLALIDSISSNPGVVVPWEKLVELFREKDILSCARLRCPLLTATLNTFSQTRRRRAPNRPASRLAQDHPTRLLRLECAQMAHGSPLVRRPLRRQEVRSGFSLAFVQAWY